MGMLCVVICRYDKLRHRRYTGMYADDHLEWVDTDQPGQISSNGCVFFLRKIVGMSA